MVRFLLNNQVIETEHSSGETTLDFVRYSKRLVGTKIGCREGDCGACTILVGDFEKDRLVYRTMTSCLLMIGNVHNKHIVTIEGINLPAALNGQLTLSPAQQAMVDACGTQCGFCTIGFVMSLTCFILNEDAKGYSDAIANIDGNICRCTGYKSIERATEIILEKMKEKPVSKPLSWLVDHRFIPEYFLSIEDKLRTFKKENIGHLEKVKKMNYEMMVGGGTDLIVQKPFFIKKSSVKHLFDENSLKDIAFEKGQCHIGAAVTVSEFAESKLIQGFFPELSKYIKLISSTPIRNMATMGGNLVNASPIGDMSIFFLALDSELIIVKSGKRRKVKLKDFFLGYKIIDKASEDVIEKIIFKPPMMSFFNFEKVCKRTHLDIASVNSACQIELEKNGVIKQIHLSAGGIGPIPTYLHETVFYLKGKKFTREIIENALDIMDKEIAPISDVRGSEAYKRLLLRQLFLSHILSFDSNAKPVVQNIIRSSLNNKI